MKQQKPGNLEYLFFTSDMADIFKAFYGGDISGVYYGSRYAARDASDVLCPFFSPEILQEMSRNLSEILEAFYAVNYGIRWTVLTQAEYILEFLKTKEGAAFVREFKEAYKMDNPVEVVLALQVFLDYELFPGLV